LSSPPRKLRAGRRVAIVALLVVVALLSAVLGIWLAGGLHTVPQAPAPVGVMGVAHMVVMFVVGCLMTALGFGAYFLVLHTVCFTSDFYRPVFKALRGKLYAANIVVQLLFAIGAGALLSMVLSPLLTTLGASRAVTMIGPFVVGVVGVQLVLIWLQIWAPLERRLIEERLSAMGTSPDRIASGHWVGISDPTKSSLKKMTLVEEDVGMLWIDDDALRYQGDVEQVELRPEQVQQVDQRADAGSAAALGGVANPVLRCSLDGKPRQLRLHPEGCWTLTAAGRACDEFTRVLSEWREERAKR